MRTTIVAHFMLMLMIYFLDRQTIARLLTITFSFSVTLIFQLSLLTKYRADFGYHKYHNLLLLFLYRKTYFFAISSRRNSTIIIIIIIMFPSFIIRQFIKTYSSMVANLYFLLIRCFEDFHFMVAVV